MRTKENKMNILILGSGANARLNVGDTLKVSPTFDFN